MKPIYLIALCAVVASACSTSIGGGNIRSDGSVDAASGRDSGVGNGDGSVATDDCVAAARWIYLVDVDNAFLRYEPDSGTITEIGTLNCPATRGATPFSMAVSRNAVAYVLFNDHQIFQVSTTDASCTATDYTPDQMRFEVFGMGFVSNSVGSTDETLFIAGGPASGVGSGSSSLGTLNTAAWSVARVGALGGSPELTGNGNSELWGFLPDTDPMSVRQIDKANGNTLREFDVSAIATAPRPRAGAWAFAFWGARYYIFLQDQSESETTISRLTPDTSAVEVVNDHTGYTVVGAGVSTCAPTILF
jgi:hypothetical protein